MNRPTLFASVAALLVLCTSPARAGSVIYYSVPSSPPMIPVASDLVFPPPPASATHGWDGTFSLADAVQLDFGMGGVGEFGDAGSSRGPILDEGGVLGPGGSATQIGATFSPVWGQDEPLNS